MPAYVQRVPLNFSSRDGKMPTPTKVERLTALDSWETELMTDLMGLSQSGQELFGPGYRWALGSLEEVCVTEAGLIESYESLEAVKELLGGLEIPPPKQAFLLNAWPSRKFFVRELRNRAQCTGRTLSTMSWIRPISQYE